MEKKEVLTPEAIAALKNLSADTKNLEPGELKVGNLHVFVNETAKRVYITAFYRDRGALPTLKELTLRMGTKFALMKDFVKAKYQELKADWEETIKPEDDLDYYVDEDGRTYTIDEDGNRRYDDGLVYGVDPLTNERVVQIWLEDDTGKRFLARFIDQEKSLLVLPGDDNVYYLAEDGYLEVMENMDYIHPRR